MSCILMAVGRFFFSAAPTAQKSPEFHFRFINFSTHPYRVGSLDDGLPKGEPIWFLSGCWIRESDLQANSIGYILDGTDFSTYSLMAWSASQQIPSCTLELTSKFKSFFLCTAPHNEHGRGTCEGYMIISNLWPMHFLLRAETEKTTSMYYLLHWY